MHLLVSLDRSFESLEEVDDYISAEIPDKNNYSILYELVIKHMLHGPHSDESNCLNKSEKNVISNNEICSKGFPKEFLDSTDMIEKGYP